MVVCVFACSNAEQGPGKELPKWKGPPATDYELVAERVEDLKLDTALIKYWAGGGQTGQATDEILIYDDGTVVFSGEMCKGVKGRSHHLLAADVKRLGRAIQDTGALGKKPRCEPVPDGLGEQVTVGTRSYSRELTCDDPTPIFSWVQEAVGQNPCKRKD
jgi:hypothetical protein